MRVLCVAEDFPWPQVTGYRVRLANILRALSAVAAVDLFVALNDGLDRDPCVVPDDVKLDRVEVIRERPPRSKAVRLLRWCTSRLPLELLWRRWSLARRTFRGWRRPQYDLVWFSHIDGKLALGDLVTGPSIVDLDTLDDFRLRHRHVAQVADDEAARSLGERRSLAWRFARRYLDPRDIERWARLHRRVLAEVDAVAVCSELDRGRLDDPKVVVIRNGYEIPDVVPERHSRETAVMTMVGGLWYQPNSDGAWWFATEVLPLVLTERPGAEFRLVGRTDELVAGLHGREHVVLRGQVPDVAVELATSDVSVVPLRSGGGTRVKILEAFAYNLPVVATSVGCEGLDVIPGTHLLVADTPQEFAAACLRILGDPHLAQSLTQQAHVLVDAKYSWQRLRPRVSELAQSVAARSGVPGSDARP